MMSILKLTSLAVFLSMGTANAMEISFPTMPNAVMGDQKQIDKESVSSTDNNFERRWSWTGFTGGVEAGYSWQSDETLAPPCFDADCAAEGDGGIYGAFIGYNHQMGSFVGGIEASYTSIGNEFDDGSQVKVDGAWAIKGRIGFAMDRFHAYGLIGATHASTSVPAASPFQMLADSDWGLVYGAGLDVAITENIFGGLQYTHHQFSDFAGLGIDADMDNVMVRIGYKY